MNDEENVTATENTEAPADAGSAAPDEVTTLKSRVAGYTAKVNALSTEKTALAAELADLKVALAAAQSGTLNKDEALKAQIAAKDAEIVSVKREAALARIEAKYPETFAVLGEAAANLTAEKLAEAEARFRGVAAETTEAPPKPIGNNPPRTQGAASGAASDDQFVEGSTIITKKMWDQRPAWLRGGD